MSSEVGPFILRPEKFTVETTPNLISLLVVTDIHSNISNLRRLKNWINIHHRLFYLLNPLFILLIFIYLFTISSNRAIDVCICLGDLVTYHHSPPSSKEDELKFREETLTILDILKSLANHFIFIPGNHDLPEYYTSTHSDDFKYILLHFSSVQLYPGLIFTGLGGCVPGLSGKTVLFPGYPFKDEDDLADQLSQYDYRALASAHPHDTIVFLSHSGPDASFTSLYMKKGRASSSQQGSSCLTRLFIPSFPTEERELTEAEKREIEKTLLFTSHTAVFMHGHTHTGGGFLHANAYHPITPHLSAEDPCKDMKEEICNNSANADAKLPMRTFHCCFPPILNPGPFKFVGIAFFHILLLLLCMEICILFFCIVLLYLSLLCLHSSMLDNGCLSFLLFSVFLSLPPFIFPSNFIYSSFLICLEMEILLLLICVNHQTQIQNATGVSKTSMSKHLIHQYLIHSAFFVFFSKISILLMLIFWFCFYMLNILYLMVNQLFIKDQRIFLMVQLLSLVFFWRRYT